MKDSFLIKFVLILWVENVEQKSNLMYFTKDFPV